MQIYQKKSKNNDKVLNNYNDILKEYSDTLKVYKQFMKSNGFEPPPTRTNTTINTNCAINQKYIAYIAKYGVPLDGCFDEQKLLSC